ncbi:MAG TPA: ABC transporter ATP-binding protein [Castellaniella sp.]|uniref:ABC transporter ATP-binding protein n=1 Tax=Castellaniella sp. TaxID=1955812 RepID=UPI002F219F14
MRSGFLKLAASNPSVLADRAAFGVIDKVRMVYPQRAGSPPVVAIDEASFSFRDGEFVSLLGPSGCGKTTLLRIVAGLVDKTAGSVQVGGHEVTGPRRDFGFVFQSLNLLPWRSVLKNVLLPMEISGRCDHAAVRRAEELLDLVGLSGFGKSRPHQLSGGMQQRVALCRALIHKPDLLLMDEPFGALDELTRMEMHDLLLKIRAETKTSVIFVTHSISEAVYLSDQVVIFSKRPARIVEHLDVPLPYPRDVHVRYTPEFTQLERQASEALGVFK